MRIVIYGLSITSSWGNGHATTFRALLRALHDRGHSIHFIEKDVEWYRNHRDLADPQFCTLQFYTSWQDEEAQLLAPARSADVVVVGSYFPDAIVATRALFSQARCPVLFYDIDTPVTLAALRGSGAAYLELAAISGFDAYLSFSSGPVLRELEQSFGARRAFPLLCSVDPAFYHPVPPLATFECDLSYLGTYAADRQPALMHLLNEPATLLPASSFCVAGPQYPEDLPWSTNVRRIAHVPPAGHPAFYSSSRFSLNITRQDMVRTGYSPSVRLFEASACGATILSDTWPGLSEFLTPGEEILLPSSADEVCAILGGLSEEERVRIGKRARERILAEHTSGHRAQQFEEIVAHCTASVEAVT